MTKKRILLNQPSLIKEMVVNASKVDGDIYITTEDGRYKINAKSIMGLFSLNLARPVFITSEVEDKNFTNFLKKIEA